MVLIAVIGILAAAASIKSTVEKSLDQLSETTINDVDLSRIPDGAYTGSYKVFPVEAEVKVTVKDGSILDIEIVRHINGRGSSAETIPDRVTEAQSLNVDIVTGATYSSKVILKAIENALVNAK